VRTGNVDRENAAYSILEDGFEAYLEFASAEQALNMQDRMEIDGHVVTFWHKGKQECEHCGEQAGHKTEGHGRAMKQRVRNERRRNAYERRRQHNRDN
jgi:hypothetical protein